MTKCFEYECALLEIYEIRKMYSQIRLVVIFCGLINIFCAGEFDVHDFLNSDNPIASVHYFTASKLSVIVILVKYLMKFFNPK
jgi:hypothetical protein